MPEPIVLDLEKFNLQDLTINELEEIETIAGVPFDEFFKDLGAAGVSKMKAFKVLAYILTKRDHPGFTFADAGDIRLDFTNAKVPDPKAPRSANGSATTPRKARTRSSR